MVQNQIEIYFSVVQRKVLTPNDFTDLDQIQARLLAFQSYYEQIATPFEWKFSRADLRRVLDRTAELDLPPSGLSDTSPQLRPRALSLA